MIIIKVKIERRQDIKLGNQTRALWEIFND